MKSIILDRDDMVNGELGMRFDDVLLNLGVVDEHGDPAKTDSIEIFVIRTEER
jgi:hypothetical protein